MASERINDLPAPTSLEDARTLGETFMQSLAKIRNFTPNPGEEWALPLMGRLLGEKLFREGRPWTIDGLRNALIDLERSGRASAGKPA